MADVGAVGAVLAVARGAGSLDQPLEVRMGGNSPDMGYYDWEGSSIYRLPLRYSSLISTVGMRDWGRFPTQRRRE